MSEKTQKIEKTIQDVIKSYTNVIRNIDEEAKNTTTGRAYGGIVRMSKGKLVEHIAPVIVKLAWHSLDASAQRLSFNHTSYEIPIKKEYVDNLENVAIKTYMLDNIKSYYYRFLPDVQVYIDGKFVMAIECKTYTENAMLKRILVDFSLLKKIYPDLNCILIQLESQLGGDYSKLNEPIYGSASTHTLFSYFSVNLAIITLLQGERRIDKAIHKHEHFKPLTHGTLYKAVDTIKEILKKYK